jgi:hypothetical protein
MTRTSHAIVFPPPDMRIKPAFAKGDSVLVYWRVEIEPEVVAYGSARRIRSRYKFGYMPATVKAVEWYAHGGRWFVRVNEYGGACFDASPHCKNVIEAAASDVAA